MNNKRIYLSSPTMHGDEQEFIKEAFDTNWVAPLGPNVNAFEQAMCEYSGCGHATALSSGTAAIHLALLCLGVGVGDVVFSSDLTFAATCNPIKYVGATPVFIDSERDTWNMDPEALKKAFEKYPHPKAVIIAHLYGTPAKINEIVSICKEHNTPIIEDAAEALSSTYKGMQCGTFGDIGIYSFNGNKIITTSGGGMLVSAKEEYTKHALKLATQSREPAKYYQHEEIGYNYRMSNVVAGIGRGQMIHLEEHKAKKKWIREYYDNAFKDVEGIELNPLNSDGDANCWLTCMLVDKGIDIHPFSIIDTLEEYNVESRPIWKPMHLQPVYFDCDFFTVEGLYSQKLVDGDDNGIKCDNSVGGDIFRRGICLPSDIKNTEDAMNLIRDIILKVLKSN